MTTVTDAMVDASDSMYESLVKTEPFDTEQQKREIKRKVIAAAIAAMDVTAMVDALCGLADDDRRLEVFAEFCKSCGGHDPNHRCQCWNDE